MNNEKAPFSSPEHSKEHLELLGEKHGERIKESHERAAEKSPERSAEDIKKEALEHASHAEKESKQLEKAAERPKNQMISAHERDISYQKNMAEVQAQLSPASRTFSKVIHHPVVEKASDTIGGTVARPNAILAGAVLAFTFTLGIYTMARFYGYTLSGTETIAAFLLGWIVGIAFDYLRLLIVGKH